MTRLLPQREPRRGVSGFGLVEIIVGVAIISAVLLGLAVVGQLAFRVVDEANRRLRAAFLTEEGIEVVRLVRDTSWTKFVTPVALDSDYSVTLANGVWALAPGSAPAIDGLFDRRVRLSAVCRDASANIVSCGGGAVADAGTRKVVVSVSWTNRGRSATTAVSTYLTNLFRN